MENTITVEYFHFSIVFIYLNNNTFVQTIHTHSITVSIYRFSTIFIIEAYNFFSLNRTKWSLKKENENIIQVSVSNRTLCASLAASFLFFSRWFLKKKDKRKEINDKHFCFFLHYCRMTYTTYCNFEWLHLSYFTLRTHSHTSLREKKGGKCFILLLLAPDFI